MRKIASGMSGWVRGCCGRHPLFAAALVAAACVSAADQQLWAGLAAAGVLGAAGAAIAGWRSGLAWALCGWLAAGGMAWRDGAR